MTPTEEQKKHQVTEKLNPSAGGGFGTPGAINAVLVAMVLFEPGTMKISDAEQKLPAWLLPSYQQIFAQPLGSAGLRRAEPCAFLFPIPTSQPSFDVIAPALVEQGMKLFLFPKIRNGMHLNPVSGMRVVKYETHRS